ncbi:hypothetical protein BGX21_003678, partial [Mortierella sp. AD011]
MMGRDTCKHFEIDCDIKSRRPIRIGITQNIIRNILSLAPFNEPVAMNKILILKSPNMKFTDNILIDRLKAILDTHRATLDFKDGTQGAILRKLYEMETQLNSLRFEKHNLEEYIKEYNTSDLVMIHESKLDEPSQLSQFSVDHSMVFPKHEHIIHKMNILSENVDISEEQGGEGHSYWRMACRRHSYKDGTLHAKLYTTRSSIYSKEISERKSQLIQLRSDLQRVEKELVIYSSKHQSEMADIQKLVEKSALYTRLISRLSSERLSSEVFQRLMDADAYTRTSPENPKTVENIYIGMTRKDALDPEVQIFNVLLLGETQSGKSSFIESVKKYSDPDYIIDFSNIGSSVSSCTENVILSTTYTNLPIVQVVKRAPGSSPTVIDLRSLIDGSPDVDDFEDALNRNTFRIVQSSESPKLHQFNLIDTPGLNDTRGRDEEHIASIYKALRDAGDIHLVLVTIGTTPFNPGLQAAIKCYFDMFPEFHGLVAF